MLLCALWIRASSQHMLISRVVGPVGGSTEVGSNLVLLGCMLGDFVLVVHQFKKYKKATIVYLSGPIRC